MLQQPTHLMISISSLFRNLPEPGVSRGPFELVLFVQVNSEAVAPGEALIAHVALVASDKIPLVVERKR